MLAAVQVVEVGDAVDAAQHRFAVQDEGVESLTQRGFCDAWVPAAPVVTVAGSQPHGLAVPLNDQAVAVVLNLVKPLWPVGDLGPARRHAGVEGRFSHSG